MRVLSPGFFSGVVFPVTYQGLFTYFLLLSGARNGARGLFLLALLGMAMTAQVNFVRFGRCSAPGFLGRALPLLVAVVVALMQTAFFLALS